MRASTQDPLAMRVCEFVDAFRVLQPGFDLHSAPHSPTALREIWKVAVRKEEECEGPMSEGVPPSDVQ